MNGKTLDLFPMLESSSEVHLGTASDDSLNRVREQRAPLGESSKAGRRVKSSLGRRRVHFRLAQFLQIRVQNFPRMSESVEGAATRLFDSQLAKIEIWAPWMPSPGRLESREKVSNFILKVLRLRFHPPSMSLSSGNAEKLLRCRSLKTTQRQHGILRLEDAKQLLILPGINASSSGFDSFWVNKTADGDLDLATFGFGHLANSIVIAVSVSSGAADAVPTMHLLDYRHRFDADLDLTDLGFTHGFGHVDGELVPRHTWNIAQSTWDDIRLNGTGLDSGRTRLLYAVTINYPRPQNVGFTTSGISSHLQ
ncbi:hypothetical protein CPB85DRAFT_1253401 [Mucidula mucida]|nr:hypothetical protein CPB85DRAFT_1253401 [Mucidula mucida]